MNTITPTFLDIFSKYVPKNGTIILAFSGGPDSVYLLHKLLSIQKKYSLNIILAHFNHKIRGKDSDADELFSKKIAEKHNLVFEHGCADIKKIAKQNALNLEDTARKKRYEFLKRAQKKHNANFIVTAHHLNDNLETFFLNFLRSSGLQGLKSMQIYSNGILRPLLHTPKNEILSYIKKHKLNFRVDKSNEDIKFARNYIRHKIVPNLEEIQPQLLPVFKRNWEHLNELFEYIDQIALSWIQKHQKKDSNDIIGLPLKPFSILPQLIQKAILQKMYFGLHGTTENITSVMLKRALTLISKKETGKKIPFGKGFMLTVANDYFQYIPKKTNKPIKKVKIKIPGKTSIKYANIQIGLLKNHPENLKNALYFDYHKLNLPLYVRSLKTGDTFKPLGMKGKKKLQDFFVDKKIPQHIRITIPIIVDAKNNIIAVGERTISDEFRVTSKSKEVLKIKIT